MDKFNRKIVGATLAGLFTGVLIGYIIGINRSALDERFLSEWTKDCGDYEDGNVFGYETGLPAEYHDKPAKNLRAQRSSIK